MPTLNWVGKDKVVNHHQEVPFRTLRHLYRFDAPAGTPANSTGNRIIHGDNLEALKALLPEYEGRVKCIYIDPPYNTGNEGWVYNDNVNDPKIKKWLGQVVGKEGEDLSRHDKWLCMMYPRLKLLHRLLAEDGSIWISIDDSEMQSLRLLMDEIFGRQLFIASNVWQKRYSRENREAIGDVHEYVVVYSKSPEQFKLQRNRIPLNDEQSKIYKNLNHDPKGRWRAIPMTAQGYRPNQMYPIVTPSGKTYLPPEGRCWSLIESEFRKLEAAGRIYFGKNGDAQPGIIRYLSEVEGLVPWTWWPHDEVGHTDEAKKEIRELFGTQTAFDTPKPVRLIERVLRIATKPGDLILDSFAGSGTTAHAVLKLNQQDGGARKFILIETMDYAETITAERVRRVMKGYGEGAKAVEGLGGGFDFYQMGDALFLPDGNLNESVGVEEIRRYVAYTEGVKRAEPETKPDGKLSRYLLGMAGETAVIFYYEPDRVTKLDTKFLAALKFKPAAAIIYADLCLLEARLLKRHNIIFKKIPREIRKF
jgi:adenine-specific DNA-methyltransferase